MRLIRMLCAAAMLALVVTAHARADTPAPQAAAEATARLDGPGLPRTSAPGRVLTPADHAVWQAQQRARILLAIGIAGTVSAAGHVAWAAPHRVCGYGHERNASLVGAATLGAMSMALTILGGLSLARSRRQERFRATRSERAAVVWSAVGAAVGMQGVLGMLRGLQLPGCST